MRSSRVAAAAAVLALSACGSDEAPQSPPSDASATSPAPSSPEGSAGPSPSTSAALPPSTEGVRLFGDGIDLPSGVLTFGTPLAAARAALEGTLGAPTKDTGPVEPFGSYGTCPGTTLQVLEYGDGALQVLFGSVGSVDAAEPVLHTWALIDTGDPAAVPQASALVGDVATVEFGVGTTVGELRQEAGEVFQLREDAMSMDPAFVVQDQSSGFHGFLTGTTDEDRVTFVEAGSGCGE